MASEGHQSRKIINLPPGGSLFWSLSETNSYNESVGIAGRHPKRLESSFRSLQGGQKATKRLPKGGRKGSLGLLREPRFLLLFIVLGPHWAAPARPQKRLETQASTEALRGVMSTRYGGFLGAPRAFHGRPMGLLLGSWTVLLFCIDFQLRF